MDKGAEEKVLLRYQKKIPVICQRDLRCKDVPELRRRKYLVPKSLKVMEFLYYLRRMMTVPEYVSIFLYVNNTLPSLNLTMGLLYEEERCNNGFLYIYYATEHTFGA